MNYFLYLITVLIITVPALCFASITGKLDDFYISLVPRPQTPVERPYIIREVSFLGGSENVLLAGELTVPIGEGPFTAIVMVPGSEPADRNSEITKHKFFLVISDFLTKRGYAVLRFDDRGIGESTGDYNTAIDADLAADAAAALKWLRLESDVNILKSGYLGHSQGAYKATVAVKTTPADFMIFLAGGLESLENTILRQQADMSKASGTTKEEIKAKKDDYKRVFSILKKSKDINHCKHLLKEYGTEIGVSAEPAIIIFCRPWWLDQMTINPTSTNLDYDLPTLALFGSKDLLVSSKINEALYKEVLTNSLSETHTFNGLNHMFQQAKKGGPDEYWKIKMTFDENVAIYIDNWLKKTVK